MNSSPKLKAVLMAGLLAGGCAVFAPNRADAACFSTADLGANGCLEFTPTTSSFAVQTYSTANLSTNQFAQFGFLTNGPSVSLTGVQYSFDSGANWINYDSGTFSASSTVSYGSLLNSASIQPGLKFRYTIPSGLALGNVVQSVLLTANNNSGNPLVSVAGNNFAQVDRSSTAAVQPPSSAPGPLPILGAAAAFSASRRLRRRIQGAG